MSTDQQKQQELIDASYALIGKAAADILATLPYIKAMREIKSRNLHHSQQNYIQANALSQSVIAALPEELQEAHARSMKGPDSM